MPSQHAPYSFCCFCGSDKWQLKAIKVPCPRCGVDHEVAICPKCAIDLLKQLRDWIASLRRGYWLDHWP